VTLTWGRRGERRRVPYENPQRRRLNALAATVQTRHRAELYWLLARRHFDAVDLVGCLEQLADPERPTVVVLDNASFHRAHEVREALPRLRRLGLYLYYLPPYSPELNAIERLFRALKHHGLPERSYATFDALHDPVHQAFARYEDAHCLKPAHQPGLAA
jgi:DDE superfamily endonuclease